MKHFSRLFLALLPLLVSANAYALDAASVKGKQAIIIDYDTGAILLEKNADERMPTSSMSKVLTMYTVFDAIKSGKLSMDQTLPVSETAWRMQGSKTFVPLGGQVKVSDLVQGVITQSGNDATIVLAEGIAGSEGSFAELMNKHARRLGMVNSNFMNASGWPDENHYSTARDLAILAWNLIHDFPDYYALFSVKEFAFNGIKQGNRNPLLYRNIGADGIKTGHTEAAGYGLMASGVQGDRRVIMVTNGFENMQERADETAKMLDWALKNFVNKSLFEKNRPVAEAPVVLGKTTRVALAVPEDLKLTLPRFHQNRITVTAEYKSPLVAPIKVGDEVGVVKISIPGLPDRRLPLVAGEAVEQQSFFSRAVSKIVIALFGV